MYAQRFYFRQGLPDIKTIEDKFYEITGLNIELKIPLLLNQIMSEDEDIIYQLTKDRDKRNFILSAKFEGDKIKAQQQLTSFGNAHFYCKDFDAIYIGDFYNDKSFYIEYESGNHMYFFLAFIKTIFEIGGQNYAYHNCENEEHPEVEDFLKPYHPHERKWKSIKKWTLMSDYEKASFQQ